MAVPDRVGRRLGVAVLTASAAFLAACGGGAGEPAVPGPTTSPAVSDPPATVEPTGFSWPTSAPSAAGFDVDALRAGLAALEASDSNAHRLVVVRDGAVVVDATFFPSAEDELHDLASLTKSVVALVVGAAIERGDLPSLDVELGSLLDLPDGSAAAATSLRDLLGMRSGLECSADDGEAELRAMIESPDAQAFAAALPAAGPPGERFAYCSPGYHLVSGALGQLVGEPLSSYAGRILFAPLGIDVWDWPSDDQGVTHGWGDLALAPPDLARLGQLVLQDGRWRDEQLLPAGFVDELRAPIATDDQGLRYGHGWWLPTDLPAGTLEGIGRGGQELLVDPEHDLVVVVTGAEVGGQLIARTIAGLVRTSPVVDGDADAEIAERFAALADPPTPVPPTSPGLRDALDASFVLDPNPLLVDRVRVAQTTEDEATVELDVGTRTFTLPVGLDGVARLSSTSPTGGPVALTGRWDGPVLEVDYEARFGPDHWTIRLDLGSDLTMTVTDLADQFPPIVVGGSTS